MATLTLKKPSTRVLKKPEPVQADLVAAYRDHLAETYPILFNLVSPKPLALGIREAMLKTRPDGVSKTTVRRFLAKWTRRKHYQKVLAVGGHRFGLNGMPAMVAFRLNTRSGRHERENYAGTALRCRPGPLPADISRWQAAGKCRRFGTGAGE